MKHNIAEETGAENDYSIEQLGSADQVQTMKMYFPEERGAQKWSHDSSKDKGKADT